MANQTQSKMLAGARRPTGAAVHWCAMCRSTRSVEWYVFKCPDGVHCTSPTMKRTNQLMTGDHWHGTWLCAACRQGRLKVDP